MSFPKELDDVSMRLKLNNDKTLARLDVERQPVEEITSDFLFDYLQKNQVVITDDVEKRIQEIIEMIATESFVEYPVISRGRSAVPCKSGYFEWSEQCDPEKRQKANHPEGDGPEEFNYYDYVSFCTVKKGDLIGKIHPPKEGEDGVDVFGQIIPIDHCDIFQIDIGKNIELDMDGVSLIALCDGVLEQKDNKVSVDPVLNIDSDIDFSTGNIHYQGDVYIKGDVKDLFEVNAEGDLYIGGTIEAATIKCGGNLTVQGGISAKDKGVIEVKKDLTAKYISNATVWVKGNVFLHSEMVNSELNCGGKLVLERAGIRGGRVTTAKAIETPEIGSSLGIQTVIRPGIDPYLEKQMMRVNAKIKELEQTIAEKSAQLKKIMANIPEGTSTPQAVEIAKTLKPIHLSYKKLVKAYEKLEQKMNKTCCQIVMIHKTVYPGVEFESQETSYEIKSELHGLMKLTKKCIDGSDEFELSSLN